MHAVECGPDEQTNYWHVEDWALDVALGAKVVAPSDSLRVKRVMRASRRYPWLERALRARIPIAHALANSFADGDVPTSRDLDAVDAVWGLGGYRATLRFIRGALRVRGEDPWWSRRRTSALETVDNVGEGEPSW